MAALQRMACLKVKLTHVGFAVCEYKRTQFCVYTVLSRSTVYVPE